MTDNARQTLATGRSSVLRAVRGPRQDEAQAERSDAVRVATSYPLRLGLAHVASLQRLVGNQVVGQVLQRMAAQLQRAQGGIVIQRKSEIAVRQELKTGAMAANMTGNFISSHGQGADSNIGAAKIHSARKTVPLTNTVIKDLRALKDNIHDQPFGAVDNGWSVTTRAAVSLVDTTKKAGAIGAKPQAPKMLVTTAYGGETFHYDSDGDVESVDGVALTEEELAHANATAGAKPKSSAKAPMKNAWRAKFLAAVNDYRRGKAADADTTWVKAYFASINGVATSDEDDVDQIPEKQSKVTVFIKQNTGDIYHLDGTDDENG